MKNEKLIFELSRRGRKGFSAPKTGVPSIDPEKTFSPEMIRGKPEHFPELSEMEVIRHFTRLAHLNFSIDTHFYPLGSCTMKYNPRMNEVATRMSGFANAHPMLPAFAMQGTLRLMAELEDLFSAISGLPAVTLQPCAGAHGELTGIMMIRAYHSKQGNARQKVLVPNSAHGTNPATATQCGYKIVEVKSGPDGCVDTADLSAKLDEEVAALMITNPNTLGLFEKDIVEICRMCHDVGARVYMDGANLNALMGHALPADMGVDALHFNLHKTFSTPHGGGGPGAGPIAVVSDLEPFLPLPRITREVDSYSLAWDKPDSIGRMSSFFGNFGVLVRAYAYIRRLGREGLKRVADYAVLNANYMRVALRDVYEVPYPGVCMHEVVFSHKRQKRDAGVTVLDISKALLDRGFHAPTMSFPLVVHGAIMTEPTETESRDTMDAFIEAMKAIDRQAREDAESIKEAPVNLPLKRLDEYKAARFPKLRWKPENNV